VPDDEADAMTATWWSDPGGRTPATTPVRPAGLHRADGLSGPPRQYLAIVVLLAGTASLPLVTAIVTGPVARGDTAFAGASPFLAPPSSGPVVISPSAATRTGQPWAALPNDAQPADGSPPAQTEVRRPAATGRSPATPARWVMPSPSARATPVESEQPGTYRRPWPVRLPWASPSPAPTQSPEPSPTPDAAPDPSGTPEPSGTPDPTPSPTLEPSPTMTTPEPTPS